MWPIFVLGRNQKLLSFPLEMSIFNFHPSLLSFFSLLPSFPFLVAGSNFGEMRKVHNSGRREKAAAAEKERQFESGVEGGETGEVGWDYFDSCRNRHQNGKK